MGDGGKSSLEADHVVDIIRHRSVENLLGFIRYYSRRLFNEKMLAGIETVEDRLS